MAKADVGTQPTGNLRKRRERKPFWPILATLSSRILEFLRQLSELKKDDFLWLLRKAGKKQALFRKHPKCP